MTVPRIDVIRRIRANYVGMNEAAWANLETLYLMAYERPRATTELVRASWNDYALDTHGNPKARRAYRGLAGGLLAAMEIVERTNAEVIAILEEGDPPGNNRAHPRTATTAEVYAAIEAQRRRVLRGEYTPARTWPQPKAGT